MQALKRWTLLWLLNNPPVRTILVSLLVCYIHFSVIIDVLHSKPAPITPKKRIAVRTIEVQPEKKVVTKTVVARSAVKNPKKAVKKAPAKKVVKKTVPKKKQELYSKLEKQINTLSKPIKKEDSGKITVLPKTLTPKSTEKAPEELHAAYLEEVLSLLYESLELPEVGSVKAKVELGKEGTFLSITIVTSQSAKNAAYLQNHLPQLSYPPFNGSLTGKERETFEITFRNAQ